MTSFNAYLVAPGNVLDRSRIIRYANTLKHIDWEKADVTKPTDQLASAAAELGRRGGLKGGRARAENLTEQQRQGAARLAALSRWDAARGITRATHEGVVALGPLELECAVLPGGIRVLSQRTITRGLGRYRPGGRGATDGEPGMPRFLAASNLQAHVTAPLREALLKPILYRGVGSKGGGQPAQGVLAELLPQVCEVWMDANKAGTLKPQQLATAKMAEVIHRALARTGIIALIDEATGYQYDRARDALATILEAFIAKELAQWVKTFSDDFYRELFRLRGLKTDDITRRPSHFGHLTNNVVYSRLAPGVLEELRNRNPLLGAGRRRHKHFQWLTPEVGHPKLREHLAKVTVLMQISPDWKTFVGHLDQVVPKVGSTFALPFPPISTQ